ncbi:MAG: heme-binding protein [Myxococcaceae bacterium]|nr:heme-binding protein [Myxococcaceae bacterium]
MKHTLLAVSVLLGSATSMAIESPKYEVVKRYDGFEVRRYASYVVAETEVQAERTEAGNAAFGRLANYIFGGNSGSKKIAMTAPVTQSQRIEMTTPVTQQASGPSTYVVQFSMPAAFTLETLPQPQDARVTLKTVPARVVAVVRYSGTWSEENYREHLDALKTGLTKEGLVATGEPVWARYDPPYTPWFLRTNEIQLELVSAPAD